MSQRDTYGQRYKFSMRFRRCVVPHKATRKDYDQGDVRLARANKGYWYRDGNKVTA